MSQTEKGVLIFDEWFNAMEDIKVTDFKRLVYAIYRLQRFEEEPPEFEGKAKVAASIIFPMIKRRRALAEYGSMGAAKRLSHLKSGDEGEYQEKEALMEALREASSRGVSPLDAIEEKKEEKKRRAYSPRGGATGERSASRKAQASGGGAAKSKKDEEWDDFFDAAVARSLGEYLK